MSTYYENALRFKGAPYKSGGMDINGMDCSGLVNAATGQKNRVWSTSAGKPPGNWQEIKPNAVHLQSHDNFIKLLKKGDLLLWKGHVAFFAGGVQLFHARTAGKPTDFTNDLKLYWLNAKGYPTVYRQL
ncbi:MAG: NlpC/P60 family protein [Bacteroidetes bacterium]|nr:NlpC/P60 family protein [Bacteroidota bacterium]